MHRFVKRPAMAWATGVLFEREATAALAELLADGQQIEIRACGPEAMGLLSAVSFDLDALNESFQGLKDKVARLVPCPCEVCANSPVPHFFDHGQLVRRLDHGKAHVECAKSYQEMDVVKLMYKLPGWTKGEPGEGPTTFRIFLASSSELREDRDAFELYMRQRNDELREQGFYLEIVRWENFLDAMSDTRLQEEYNKAVRACDVFVALFFTKAGKFTEEEFAAAWGQFKTSGKPKIWTYFKNAEIKTGSARRDDLNLLWDFRDKLKALGHYPSNYDNPADLKLQFRDQLDRLTTGWKARRAQA
jgi:hypothetical protein